MTKKFKKGTTNIIGFKKFKKMLVETCYGKYLFTLKRQLGFHASRDMLQKVEGHPQDKYPQGESPPNESLTWKTTTQSPLFGKLYYNSNSISPINYNKSAIHQNLYTIMRHIFQK